MKRIDVWRNMKARCRDEGRKDYHRYGGRGIDYCQRWESFELFGKDMGRRPEGTQLERINNNEGYYPQNCRWATPKEQANNRRNNRLITIGAHTRTMAQWCDLSSLKPSTIRQRFYVYGWSVEKSLGMEV